MKFTITAKNRRDNTVTTKTIEISENILAFIIGGILGSAFIFGFIQFI